MPVLQILEDRLRLNTTDQLLHIILVLVILPEFEYFYQFAKGGIQLFHLLEIVILRDYLHCFRILLNAMQLYFDVVEGQCHSLDRIENQDKQQHVEHQAYYYYLLHCT